MRGFGWAMVAGFLLWLALAQNGVIPGPRALLRRLAAMGGDVHTMSDDETDGEESHETTDDDTERECSDGNDCAHGGRHWNARDMNGSGERKGLDDSDVLSDSRESIQYTSVAHEEKYKTKAQKAREAAERTAREVDGIDLSHLDGAGPDERKEWVTSWHRTRPMVPRSEIAHMLSKYSGVTLRQAQRDVSAALKD